MYHVPYLTDCSITHVLPLMRDVGELFGSFEVTRSGFLSALKKFGAVCMVPGGQAEMLYSQSDTTDMKLNSRHKGFIRMAITTGSHLVPVVAFGEMQLLDNLPVPHSVQKFFMRTFRANFCFLPYGVGYLPVPRPVPYHVVVGDPIAIPHVVHPTNDMVDAVHRYYYQRVKALFDSYKGTCGYADNTITLVPDVTAIEEAEWKSTLQQMNLAHQHEHADLREIKTDAVRAFDMFRGHETIWVTTFMLFVFSTLVYRGWSTLDLTSALTWW